MLILYIPNDIVRMILFYCHAGNQAKDLLQVLIQDSYFFYIEGYIYKICYAASSFRFPRYDNDIVDIFIGEKF